MALWSVAPPRRVLFDPESIYSDDFPVRRLVQTGIEVTTVTRDRSSRVIVKGGLGNQLFIASAADAITNVTGATIELDFTLIRRGISSHGNSIERFLPSNALVWKGSPVQPLWKLERLLARVINNHQHYVANSIGFDENVFDSEATFRTIEGYFQSFRYLELGSGLPHIVYQNMLSESAWGVETGLELAASNSLAIHVRRGDYVENRELFGLIDWPKQLASNLWGLTELFQSVALFGDDQEFIQGLSADLGPSFKAVIAPASAPAFETMVAMSLCRQLIISNSSFAYWAAMLGKEKAVWYPTPWFKGLGDPRELAPSSWQSFSSTWVDS